MKLGLTESSYEGLLEDWKLRMVIAGAIRRRFSRNEIADVLQEIVPVIMQFKYDPQKSNGKGEEAALRSLIDHILIDIRRKNMRSRKHHRRYAELSGDGSEPLVPDTTEECAFSMDVKEVLSQLSPEERAACEAAAREPSLDEAAASLNTTRYLLQRTLDVVRKRFERAGF